MPKAQVSLQCPPDSCDDRLTSTLCRRNLVNSQTTSSLEPSEDSSEQQSTLPVSHSLPSTSSYCTDSFPPVDVVKSRVQNSIKVSLPPPPPTSPPNSITSYRSQVRRPSTTGPSPPLLSSLARKVSQLSTRVSSPRSLGSRREVVYCSSSSSSRWASSATTLEHLTCSLHLGSIVPVRSQPRSA